MMASRLDRRQILAAGASFALALRPASAQARKLRVGVLRLSSSGAVFLAQDLGYFREAGLDVELVFFGAAQPIARVGHVVLIGGGLGVAPVYPQLRAFAEASFPPPAITSGSPT